MPRPPWSTDIRPDRRRFLGRVGTAGPVAVAASVGVRSDALAAEAGGSVVGRPVVAERGDGAAGINDLIDRVAGDGGGTVVIPGGSPLLLDEPVRLRANVTLQGVGATATVLESTDGDRPVVVHGPDVEGATVADLALRAGSEGLLVEGPARYLFLRRLHAEGSAGAAIDLGSGPFEQVYLDVVRITDVGGPGVRVGSAEGRQGSIFLSALTVDGFGADGSAALELAARCMVNQLQIGPFGPEGQDGPGVRFLAGSEHSVVSNFAVSVAGGAGFVGTELDGIRVGTGVVVDEAP